jgi:hypothetical protein
LDGTLAIALVVAVVGPVILSILNGRQRRAERKMDWAREDQKAKDAADAALAAQESRDRQAALLAEDTKKARIAAEEVARLTASARAETRGAFDEIKTTTHENAVTREAAAAAFDETRGALDEIKTITQDNAIVGRQTHTLVNSNMDEQKVFLLRSTERELVSLSAMRSLLESLDRDIPGELAAAIDTAKATIADLKDEIAIRKERLVVATEDAETDKASANTGRDPEGGEG